MKVTNVRCVYRELRADYLRGTSGLSSRPCRSPRTGSGPPRAQTCLLYCKTALREGVNGTFSSTSISWGGGSIAEERESLIWKATSESVPHQDLISQRVAQNHADKLPIPRPLDILAALTAAVGWVILEFKGNPDGFSTCGTWSSFITT